MTEKKDDKKNVRAIRAGIEIVAPPEYKLPDPNLDVISALELLLEEAKEGMLQEIAFSVLYADYSCLCDFVGEWNNPSAMLGELAVLQQNYMMLKHPSVLFPIVGHEDYEE